VKIAIVSDIHLGDPGCSLLGERGVSPRFGRFAAVVKEFTGGKPLDYLVLDGDILDFSISPFHETLTTARPFFQKLKSARIAKELVYVPGNHDKHIWDAVEWQTNVTRRLENRDDARPFKRTQPGLIDLVNNTPLELPGVSRDPDTGLYGDIFLKGLFKKNTIPLPITVVYPNLYIDTNDGLVLVTHGHMLDLAWTLLSELLRDYFPGKVGIRELEEWNVPITSMICTSIGQGGKVSELIYGIQKQAKKGKSKKLKKVLDEVLPRVEKIIDLPWYAEAVDDILLAGLRKAAPSIAESTEAARYDKEFFERRDVRRRFRRFYAASARQAEETWELDPPSHVIFGHTHEAIPARKPLVTKKGLPLYNCGGWLKGERGKPQVFFLDDAGKISSKRVM
jgi:Calcineurin-like phosphoesterase